MSVLPFLLYAFGTATKSKRDRERAASITNFGQIGGKGPVISVGPNETAPEGFVAFAAQTGLGQSITIPQKTEVDNKAHLPLFAGGLDALPGSEKGAQEGFRTKSEWYDSWKNLPIAEFNVRNSKLIQVGTRGPDGQININTNMLPKEDETTTPTQIGPKRFGVRFNDKFIPSSREGIAKLEGLIQKAEDSGTAYDIQAGFETTLQQEVSGQKSNFQQFTPQGEIPALLKAAMAADIDSNLPYRHIVNGKEEVLFTPSNKSIDFYNKDIASFVAQNAATGFDYSTLAPGTLDRLHLDMFDYIKRQNTMTISSGVIAYDPNKLSEQTAFMYPDEMKVPGFKGYYTARVNGVEEEIIKDADAAAGIDPETSATYLEPVPNNPDMKITIPTELKDIKYVIEPYKQAFSWAVSAYSDSKNPMAIAKNKMGNLIARYPNPNDPAAPLMISDNQFGLLNFARLASQSVEGISPLTNAKNAYDPSILNPLINNDQLIQVANVMNDIDAPEAGKFQNKVLFNRKMSFVNAFAPDLESVGTLQSTFNRATFFRTRFAGKDFSDMQRQVQAGSRYGLEAVRLINESAALLFEKKPNGSIEYTPFGQQIGESYVSLSGLYANAKAAAGLGLEALGYTEDNPIAAGIASAIDTAGRAAQAFESGDPNAANIVDQQFGSYRPLSEKLTATELEEEARKRGFANTSEFIKAENVARRENIAKVKSLVTDMSSGDSRKANIARRQYLNYVIAYTVAAALQGGTGGRTISDQDVQNVLNFLNPGTFSEPQIEYDNLMSLAADLTYRGQRDAALASPNKNIVHNAMIVLDLDARAGGTPISTLIRRRLESGATGAAPKEEEIQEGSLNFSGVIVQKSDAEKFFEYATKALRKRDEYRGMTFSTLKDLEDAKVTPTSLRLLATRFNDVQARKKPEGSN